MIPALMKIWRWWTVRRIHSELDELEARVVDLRARFFYLDRSN